jgi:GH18 family chitinase
VTFIISAPNFSYVDYVNLIAHDYFASQPITVHHHSPLYPLEKEKEDGYNMEFNAVR